MSSFDNMQNQIHLYCDDAPDDEKGGFSSILGNLVKSAKLPAGCIIHTGSGLTRIAIQRNSPIRVWKLLGQRGYSRSIILRLPLLVLDWLRFGVWPGWRKDASNVKSICVLVGADWTSLLRGLIVARRVGARRKTVYVVDNIYELMKGGPTFLMPLVQMWTTYLLKRFDQHFAITDGLSEALQNVSGLEWQSVDLPYDFDVSLGQKRIPSVKVSKTPRCELVFVGAITPYVSPMLVEILELISSETHGEHSFELHLLSRKFPNDFLDRFRSELASGTLRIFSGVSDEQMVERYADTGVLVCPYSRRLEHKSFISQSFPSKLLKMIHSGLPCLILAPSYAAVCKSHGLFITALDLSGSFSEFKCAIAEAEVNAPKVAALILDRHSPANFIKRVSA